MADMMGDRVAGKVALITGGGAGIGRATAIRLAREGALVTITDLDKGRCEAVAAELGDNGAFLTQNVCDEGDWEKVMADLKARHGRLDVLVNNAGILGTEDSQTIEDLTLEEWRRIHSVNVEGVYLGCRYGVKAMKATGGSIINLSSIAGIIASPHVTSYGASKGAVRQFTKSIAVHCGRQGYDIRCNSVHPGVIRTDMGEQVMKLGGGDPDEGWRKRTAQIPLGRPGHPDDIANGILFLASDESRYMTGAELVIDGGYTVV